MTFGGTRTKAILALVAVFAAGVVMGAVGHRTLHRGGPMPPDEFRKRLLDGLTQDLGLDERQRVGVDEVLTQTASRFESVREALGPELEAIRAERAERIMVLLNAPQQAKYEEIIKKRRRRRGDQSGRAFRDLRRR